MFVEAVFKGLTGQRDCGCRTSGTDGSCAQECDMTLFHVWPPGLAIKAALAFPASRTASGQLALAYCGSGGRGSAAPPSKAAALIDLTGYWSRS